MSRANVYPGRFGILVAITTISNNTGNMRAFKSEVFMCSGQEKDAGRAVVNNIITASYERGSEESPCLLFSTD